MLHQTDSIPANAVDLKYANREQVVRTFLDGKTHTASEIAAATGLSRQTVMKSILFFVSRNLLVAVGKGPSTQLGGKPPELFSLSRSKYFLCITLWPRNLQVRLCTIAGDCVDALELDLPLPENPRAAVDNAARLGMNLLQKNRVGPADLCAVSLSTAGIIRYGSGQLRFSSQSPQWHNDVPLRSYLEPYFGDDILIFVENAGKMAARPYLLEPQLAGKRVLTIFSCWGLSSCLIEKGTILNGHNSLIGEIGHMVVNPADTEQCGCGSRGCLERLVSVERIRRILTAGREQYPDSRLAARGDSIVIPELFQFSAAGDPLAREVVNKLAGAFAVALQNISLVFDPEVVIFQGDYAHADAYFDQCLRERLGRFQYFPADGAFEIRYDRRPLAQMDAQGSCIALAQRYFSQPELFLDN